MEEQERLTRALADRYRIEHEIGRGGMATVYRAHDPRHDRPVAIKVLRSELAAGLGPERFVREIEISAKLTHPHILPLFDSGEADGFLYYVMPYVEGESLRDRLAREGRIPAEEALRCARELEAEPSAVNAELLAGLYAALGEREEALRWLEYEPTNFSLPWTWAEPLSDAFRDDPRFQAVFRRMNLEFRPGQPAPVALPVVHPELTGMGGSTWE